jgi:hypothetical protein
VDSPRWREPIIISKEEHAFMDEENIRRELSLNYMIH